MSNMNFFNKILDYSDNVSWILKSSATWLFVQHLFSLTTKKNTKAANYKAFVRCWVMDLYETHSIVNWK